MIALDNKFRLRKRNRLSPITSIIDVADYKVGYILTLPFIKIIKVKISQIMDSPKYITIVSVFGMEFVR
jgi:hypothetical protein